jgi:hypothetical protein
MRYTTFWMALQKLASVAKLASSDDATISHAATIKHAEMCDSLYEVVRLSSTRMNPEESEESVRIASVIMLFRDDHRITGEKLAASPEVAAALLEKLATAGYVDNILTLQLEKLSGAEYDAARNVQLLGREYAVHLMRGLFA